jgi:hypothetical protein
MENKLEYDVEEGKMGRIKEEGTFLAAGENYICVLLCVGVRWK